MIGYSKTISVLIVGIFAIAQISWATSTTETLAPKSEFAQKGRPGTKQTLDTRETVPAQAMPDGKRLAMDLGKPREVWGSRQWKMVSESELCCRNLAGKTVFHVGPSIFLEHVAAEALLGAQVTAIDNSPVVIKIFDRLTQQLADEFPDIRTAGGQVTYKPWDLEYLDEPFAKEELIPHSFDHVTMMRVGVIRQNEKNRPLHGQFCLSLLG